MTAPANRLSLLVVLSAVLYGVWLGCLLFGLAFGGAVHLLLGGAVFLHWSAIRTKVP